MDSGSSYEVIYEHCFLKLKPSIQGSKVDSQVLLVGFLGGKSWAIGEVLLEITIGNDPLTRSETLNFVITVTIGKQLSEHFKERLRNLLRTNADVFAWTHADMMGIPRTITVNGKPFNTEYKLNEYSHIKPIKQKKQSLGPDRSTTARKAVEELTRAGILREAIH
ncbi:hypothetical protein Tco_1214194 [Tanacetum coccineum]